VWKQFIATIFILSSLIFCSSSPALSEEKSFCHDPEAEAGWQKLLQENPGDKHINILHGLRIGLCEKLDLEQLTVKEASVLFESARTTLVEDIKQRQLDQDELSKQEMKKFAIILALLKHRFQFDVCAAERDEEISEDENYCHDLEANAKWNEMVMKYPTDYALHVTHAIRIGICEKIDRGEIGIEQGTSWFQELFDRMKESRFEEKLNESIERGFGES